MTTVLDAPLRRTPRDASDTAPGRADGDRRPLSSEALAALCLIAFSATVAAGFARVFSGWDFFDNLLVLVVVGHGGSLVLRRRLNAWVALPLVTVALAWVIAVSTYRDTLGNFLVPTWETWRQFTDELTLVRSQFRTAVAPVPFDIGWDALAAIGVAAAVLLADTFAFRAYARAEALVPGGVLFVFVAALGEDRNRIALTVALVAAGVLATIALRLHHAGAFGQGSARRATRPPAAGAVFGAVALAGVVALAAGAVGPRLPGAGADPLYETRGGGGGVTDVVSPLVDIRSRLTNRSNSEMFVVQADAPAYWRSSALIQFDGSRWGLPERDLVATSGQLTDVQTRSVEIRQLVRIVNLGGALVPAAADPIAATAVTGNVADELRWNGDSSTLVTVDDELVDGDIFEIVSAAPQFDPQALANASSTDAGDPIYTDLPDGFPTSVAATAAEVTDGVATPYGKARALQDWFRSEFDYSLEVQSGHGDNAMEAFLRARIGYCEQFAGTYAAMMRSLGIPARVAVGFTSGLERGDGVYSVLGKNAHAWPEVWFDGLGWVPFEPTPGRGAPGAEDYTGVPAEQDASGVDPDAPRETTPLDAPTTTLFPGGSTGDDSTSNLDGLSDALLRANLDPSSSSAPPADDDGGFPWFVVILLAALAVAVAAPTMVRAARRARPLHDEHAELARLWRRAVDTLADAGVRRAPTHTPLEYAANAGVAFPVAARPAKALADAVTEATYGGPDHTGPTLLRDCAMWCNQIDRAVADSVTWRTRIARHFRTWR